MNPSVRIYGCVPVVKRVAGADPLPKLNQALYVPPRLALLAKVWHVESAPFQPRMRVRLLSFCRRRNSEKFICIEVSSAAIGSNRVRSCNATFHPKTIPDPASPALLADASRRGNVQPAATEAWQELLGYSGAIPACWFFWRCYGALLAF